MTPAEIVHSLRSTPPAVTVVGDVILDRWVRGAVQRLSREAPVPVVDALSTVDSPGGAANTAMNLAAMGATVTLVSVVSDDAEGRALLDLLCDAGVDVSGVVTRRGGATALKTRVVGDDQILVRVDRAASALLDPGDRGRLHRAVTDAMASADALLVCDYASGLLTAETVEVVAAGRRPGTVVVDAHDLRPWRGVRPDVVTPNAREAAVLLGSALEGDRVEAAARAGARVLDAAGARAAVITLDRDGTVGVDPTGVRGRTRALPAPEQQAAGAGDTFAAALTAALALGADLSAAARFAQTAADIVVSRPGTAVATLDDLSPAAAAAGSTAVLPAAALRAALREQRSRGRRIVFTNGCFDVLHPGHTAHLRQAKALGDVLVVALNDDASVARLKGPGRPVNPLEDRAAVLAALGSVDYVTSFAEDSPVRLLDDLRPELYAKGGDYTPEMLEETAVVRAYGGEVRILDFISTHSTSAIVRRIATASR